MSDWISVEDKLPEFDEPVLLWSTGFTSAAYGRLDNVNKKGNAFKWVTFQAVDYTDYEITHWMSLPNPPEVDNE